MPVTIAPMSACITAWPESPRITSFIISLPALLAYFYTAQLRINFFSAEAHGFSPVARAARSLALELKLQRLGSGEREHSVSPGLRIRREIAAAELRSPENMRRRSAGGLLQAGLKGIRIESGGEKLAVVGARCEDETGSRYAGNEISRVGFVRHCNGICKLACHASSTDGSVRAPILDDRGEKVRRLDGIAVDDRARALVAEGVAPLGRERAKFHDRLYPDQGIAAGVRARRANRLP